MIPYIRAITQKYHILKILQSVDLGHLVEEEEKEKQLIWCELLTFTVIIKLLARYKRKYSYII